MIAHRNAEGGADKASPGRPSASAAGGWVVDPTSPDFPLFEAVAEALSIVAVRAAAKRLGRRAVWRDLRGRQNPLLEFVSRTPAETLDGAALKLWLVVRAGQCGEQSPRDLRMVRDALAVVERARSMPGEARP